MVPSSLVTEGQGTGAAWTPRGGNQPWKPVLPKEDEGAKKRKAADQKSLREIGQDIWWVHNSYFTQAQEDIIDLYSRIAGDKGHPYNANPIQSPDVQKEMSTVMRRANYSTDMQKLWDKFAADIYETNSDGKQHFDEKQLEDFYNVPKRFQEMVENEEVLRMPAMKPQFVEWLYRFSAINLPQDIDIRKAGGTTTEERINVEANFKTTIDSILEAEEVGEKAEAWAEQKWGEYGVNNELLNESEVKDNLDKFIMDYVKARHSKYFKSEEDKKKGDWTWNFGAGKGGNDKFQAIYTQEPTMGGTWTSKIKNYLTMAFGKKEDADAIGFTGQVPERPIIITKEVTDPSYNVTTNDILKKSTSGRTTIKLTPSVVYVDGDKIWVIGNHVYEDENGIQRRADVKFSLDEKSTKDIFEGHYLNGMTVEEFIAKSKSEVKEEASEIPNKGDVLDGYEFLGGDPNDAKNWKKVK